MKSETPWSYSMLSAYELCPRKFDAEKISKTVPVSKDATGYAGLDTHKAFERRLMARTPLPMDLEHHEPVCAKIELMPGLRLVEQRVALNKNLRPTGFFDADVWVRGVIDLVQHNGTSVFLLDWKTGRMSDSFDQVDLFTAMFMQAKQQVIKAVGAYYWTKDKVLTKKKYTREDLTPIWEGYISRSGRMQEAIRTRRFPPKQCFLCRKHCPVKTCEYNGA